MQVNFEIKLGITSFYFKKDDFFKTQIFYKPKSEFIFGRNRKFQFPFRKNQVARWAPILGFILGFWTGFF